MVSFSVGILIALCQVWPAYSRPHVSRSGVEIVPLQTRQGTVVNIERACASSKDVTDAASHAESMAKYLEGVAAKGQLCGLDHSRSYFNMVSTDKYEVNLYFTGRVPQLQSASFDCGQMASDLRDVVKGCTNSNGQPVYARQWLVNCVTKQSTWSGDPPQPYKEGGVGIEFREKGFPTDAHPG